MHFALLEFKLQIVVQYVNPSKHITCSGIKTNVEIDAIGIPN